MSGSEVEKGAVTPPPGAVRIKILEESSMETKEKKKKGKAKWIVLAVVVVVIIAAIAGGGNEMIIRPKLPQVKIPLPLQNSRRATRKHRKRKKMQMSLQSTKMR